MSDQSPAPAVATSTTPHIKSVWFDHITHPAGASATVTVQHEYVDWTDGAQTVRPNVIGGAWLCVHPGTSWPDACEYCAHIEALTDGAK